jgi:hypothetical protein
MEYRNGHRRTTENQHVTHPNVAELEDGKERQAEYHAPHPTQYLHEVVLAG